MRAAGDPDDQPGVAWGSTGSSWFQDPAAGAARSPSADLDSIIDAEAVRLFTDFARPRSKPGFAVTAENAAAVAAVSRRLDGIALAIELAAARVPAMTPAELARRVGPAVRGAGRRPKRGAVERHQDAACRDRLVLRPAHRGRTGSAGSADGVRGRLDPGGRRGGLRRGDRIDPGAVFGLLASLVARSLVVWLRKTGPRPALPAVGDHPPVRRGTPRWGRRDRTVAGPPHAGYYADFLRQVRDPGDGAFWAVRLGAERDNLLAAWSWVTGTGDVDTRVLDPGRLRALRDLDELPVAAPRQRGTRAARRPGAPRLPARPRRQRHVRLESART